MQSILLLGAGRSASTLIRYLVKLCREKKWQLAIGDVDVATAENKAKGKARCFLLDVNDTNLLAREIMQADVVISMVPARFHHIVADACLTSRKHMVTASYLDDSIKKMNEEVKAKNLVFINECGLDPGIDHMSAMTVLDEIRGKGGKLLGFESFTGGLLAPNTNDNPWEYKFTWNPGM